MSVVSTFHTCVVVLEVKNGDTSVVSTFHTCFVLEVENGDSVCRPWYITCAVPVTAAIEHG